MKNFGKWNFLALILKDFLYFLKRKLLLYFGKRKFRKNSSYFRKRNFLLFQETSGRNFPSSKNEKSPLWKNVLYFGKWNFLVTTLKISLYFIRELAKPENQIKSYSLELLTYYCIHYSLAILFSAIGILITHPIIYILQNFGFWIFVHPGMK